MGGGTLGKPRAPATQGPAEDLPFTGSKTIPGEERLRIRDLTHLEIERKRAMNSFPERATHDARCRREEYEENTMQGRKYHAQNTKKIRRKYHAENKRVRREEYEEHIP